MRLAQAVCLVCVIGSLGLAQIVCPGQSLLAFFLLLLYSAVHFTGTDPQRFRYSDDTCACAGHDRTTSRPLSDHEEWDRALAASGPAPIINLHDEHAHHGKTSIIMHVRTHARTIRMVLLHKILRLIKTLIFIIIISSSFFLFVFFFFFFFFTFQNRNKQCTLQAEFVLSPQTTCFCLGAFQTTTQ